MYEVCFSFQRQRLDEDIYERALGRDFVAARCKVVTFLVNKVIARPLLFGNFATRPAFTDVSLLRNKALFPVTQNISTANPITQNFSTALAKVKLYHSSISSPLQIVSCKL